MLIYKKIIKEREDIDQEKRFNRLFFIFLVHLLFKSQSDIIRLVKSR